MYNTNIDNLDQQSQESQEGNRSSLQEDTYVGQQWVMALSLTIDQTHLKTGILLTLYEDDITPFLFKTPNNLLLFFGQYSYLKLAKALRANNTVVKQRYLRLAPIIGILEGPGGKP